jgi:hypothetical protein
MSLESNDGLTSEVEIYVRVDVLPLPSMNPFRRRPLLYSCAQSRFSRRVCPGFSGAEVDSLRGRARLAGRSLVVVEKKLLITGGEDTGSGR